MKLYLKPEVEIIELKVEETLMDGDGDFSNDWGVEEW